MDTLLSINEININVCFDWLLSGRISLAQQRDGIVLELEKLHVNDGIITCTDRDFQSRLLWLELRVRWQVKQNKYFWLFSNNEYRPRSFIRINFPDIFNENYFQESPLEMIESFTTSEKMKFKTCWKLFLTRMFFIGSSFTRHYIEELTCSAVDFVHHIVEVFFYI